MNNPSYKIFGTIALIMLIIGGCNESKLNLRPLAETEGDIFDEEVDFDRAVMGIYAKITDIYWYNMNQPKHRMWHAPGDDITTMGITPFETFAGLQPATPELNANGGDVRETGYWRAVYNIVSRANIVLQKIDEEDGVIKTPGMKDAFHGEALFLRAWSFFQLWNFFGPAAPVITERITSQAGINPPSSKGTELLDQAIDDLQRAANLLPASWDDKYRGRVTKSSANGMLGKVLVFRGTVNGSSSDMTEAIAAFNKINDKVLIDKYSDNFSVYQENNAESLFEFQAGSPPIFDNVWLSNDFDRAVGTMTTFWGYFDAHWSIWDPNNRLLASNKFINKFNTDPRFLYAVDSGYTNHITKYVRENLLVGAGVGSVNNPRILRYADILLLKAEAILKSGGSKSEVIGLINQIRTRARNWGGGTEPADHDTNETDENTIMQWIMDERMIELFAEEAHRWFDLRRWHMAGYINLGTWTGDDNGFSSLRSDFNFDVNTHLYFPAPEGEVNLNPNIIQNPGY